MKFTTSGREKHVTDRCLHRSFQDNVVYQANSEAQGRGIWLSLVMSGKAPEREMFELNILGSVRPIKTQDEEKGCGFMERV